MTRNLLFLLAVSLSAQTTFSDFAVDVKSHSTARIGWTMSAVATTNYNLEWDTQATPAFANATAYQTSVTGPSTWYPTAGKPTSIEARWGHSCLDGYTLLVGGAASGWAPLNGTRTCTYVDATHFTVDADTTGATTGSVGTAQYLRYEVSLGGLPAGKTIYYRACENSGANCSAVQNFNTDAQPGDPYPAPTAPTASGALSSVPTTFARTESTVTVCANLQSAINTALGRGETGNVLLPIQKGLRCIITSSPLTIGANTNTGYLVIRPDSTDAELPPNGVRISTDWEASMVTISGDNWGAGYGTANLTLTDTNRIYLMGIIFENEFPTASTKAITGATATAPIVYTSTSHGYSNGDILQIRLLGGVTGANVTNCKVQNVSTHTFECKGSSGAGSYTKGGYAVKTPPIPRQHLHGSHVHNVTVDRSIFRYVWPASGYGGAIIYFSGPAGSRSSDVNFINNLVYDINDWVPVDPDTGLRATCCSNTPYESMTVISADRVLAQNNKFAAPGISFFDDGARTTDLTFRRNLNSWDAAWKYTSAATNWVTTVRQQFEMKSCFRCKLDGNQWLNQWWGGFGQGTGAYSMPILFSGRSAADGFVGEYGFGDITVTNNLIANAPGGIGIGNAGGYQYDQKPIRNVLISNNLMYGITRASADATATNWQGGATFLVLGGPFENLRIENNTMWDNRAWFENYNRAIAFSGPSRGAYFRVHNNFWAHNNDQSTNISWSDFGTGLLPAADNTPNTDSITSKFLHDVDFSGNVVIPGVTDSTSEANYTDPAKLYAVTSCTTYWAARSGVTCHGAGETTAYARFASVGFVDYANHDFRLKDSSPYASGGARRGSDHKNLGANADAIDEAVGKVKNVRMREISSSGATLSYTAPDTDACTVEYGPSAAWGTGSRSSDGGGDKVRNVTLSGLSVGMTYYRLLCAAEQPSGSFQTP